MFLFYVSFRDIAFTSFRFNFVGIFKTFKWFKSYNVLREGLFSLYPLPCPHSFPRIDYFHHFLLYPVFLLFFLVYTFFFFSPFSHKQSNTINSLLQLEFSLKNKFWKILHFRLETSYRIPGVGSSLEVTLVQIFSLRLPNQNQSNRSTHILNTWDKGVVEFTASLGHSILEKLHNPALCSLKE